MSNPIWFKRFGGTVVMSSIGMFGPGGGWSIPITPPSLMITIGGIDTKPRYFDGSLQPREILDVTVSVDHDLMMGLLQPDSLGGWLNLSKWPTACSLTNDELAEKAGSVIRGVCQIRDLRPLPRADRLRWDRA
ncbi:MAG TPA: 2-oxo acid dehydrogenase subunit E2 [Propionibacteriaceae bacterium]|nr:2-oxo acid dehydrogenase subunit E2 [Propionibacteriaceae bacterium]